MALDRTYWFGLFVGVALLQACEVTDDPMLPSYADSGAPVTTPGGMTGGVGSPGGTTGGVGSPGGTTGGVGSPGGTTGGSTGSTPGGTQGGTPGSGSTTGGPGGTTGAGTPGGSDAGFDAGGDGGAAPADAGSDGGGPPPLTGGSCPGMPAVTDYAAKGAFDAKVFPNIGPNNNYHLFRPDASLGKDGLKHPIAVWGNGIATTPDQYTKLLSFIASHGFVVIACNDTSAERPCLNTGIEWLVQQNTAEGPMKGKLDTSKELTIGYSWGGGAAIDTANRPNVKATVSIHGMPPRQSTAWTAMKSPLLLFTSTGDTFVSASGYVTPNYNNSKVPTFYATLQENVGHLYPIDEGAVSCAVDLILGGPCAASIKEQAPMVAFMRLWACNDENAKKYFYGADCTLCKAPWKSQNKPTDAWK
jgi:hypothetical protein